MLPAERPVTRPVGLIDAIAGALLDQTPPLPLVLSWVVAPVQMAAVPLIVPALALGLTVTVNVIGIPVQPLTVAVTETVVVSGLKLLLVAVYAPILPAPFKPKPTFTVAVQLYVTVPPVVGLPNAMAAPGVLLQ